MMGSKCNKNKVRLASTEKEEEEEEEEEANHCTSGAGIFPTGPDNRNPRL